jgi:hypothetical protein
MRRVRVRTLHEPSLILKYERKNKMDDKEKKVSNTGVWVYRLLVAGAGGLMLVSWLLPWWTIDAESFGPNLVQIHPWGLEMNERLGDFVIFLKGANMPGWFAPFMWVYLGLCMIALLVGLWEQGKKVGIGKFKIKLSQFLIGGVGLSYVVAGIVAAIYASIRTKSLMHVPLLGRSFLDMGGEFTTFVESRFLIGYYLVYVAGILLIALAFLRSRICDN